MSTVLDPGIVVLLQNLQLFVRGYGFYTGAPGALPSVNGTWRQQRYEDFA